MPKKEKEKEKEEIIKKEEVDTDVKASTAVSYEQLKELAQSQGEEIQYYKQIVQSLYNYLDTTGTNFANLRQNIQTARENSPMMKLLKEKQEKKK